jgi:mutator protein MutT
MTGSLGSSAEPLHVVAGLLLRDGRVLVARRGPGMALAGAWEFPGGKVEAGETPRAALERELREELAIETRTGERLAVSEFAGNGRPIRLEGWCSRLLSGEPVAREHDALAWLRPGEVDRALLAPADLPLLDALIERVRRP